MRNGSTFDCIAHELSNKYDNMLKPKEENHTSIYDEIDMRRM